MSNMSYCRFENTYRDMQDIFEHLGDDDLSETECRMRNNIIELCKHIMDEADDIGEAFLDCDKEKDDEDE